MVRILFIGAALLLGACGASEATMPPPPPVQCPAGEPLFGWRLSPDNITLSGCDRVADITSPANQSVSLVGGYQTTPKTPITLSADLEILSGAGQFTLQIFGGTGDPSNLKTSRASGILSVRLPELCPPPMMNCPPPSPSGQVALIIQGLADPGAPMKWRVSHVAIGVGP